MRYIAYAIERQYIVFRSEGVCRMNMECHSSFGIKIKNVSQSPPGGIIKRNQKKYTKKKAEWVKLGGEKFHSIDVP